MKSQRCAFGLVCLFTALGVGCAGNQDAMQKRLDELNRNLTKMRASNMALEDRVSALEEGMPETQSVTAPAEKEDRPKLEVVRLVPEPEGGAEPPAASVEDTSTDPRPVLRADASGGRIGSSDEPEPLRSPERAVVRRPLMMRKP